MALTSTQIGAIGENLLVNAVMKASGGRLSPFQPLADDDGIDVLFFDKLTGNAIALQLKCRTVTLFKRSAKSGAAKERGNQAHFEVRKSTFNDARRTYFVAALCDEELSGFVMTWLIPMEMLPELARNSADKWVIRPNKSNSSKDKFTAFRMSPDELTQRLIALCEGAQRPVQ